MGSLLKQFMAGVGGGNPWPSYWTPQNTLGKEIINYSLPVYVHRGANSGGDDTSNDVFMNNHCETDFSDIYFTDQSGNKLNHYLASHGNYEFIQAENRGGYYNVITSDGKIIANGVDGQGDLYPQCFLYESVDNGLTWTKIYTSPYADIMALFIDSRDYLFIVVRNESNFALYRSIDGGINFSMVIDLSDLEGSWIIPTGFTENNNGDLYVGRYQDETAIRIWKSTDAGATWNIVYEDTDHRHVHRIICDQATGYIYAGLGEASPQGAIIRSIDNGANWTVIYDGIGCNPIGIYCGDGYRLFGTEEYRGYTIVKTTDDIVFTEVLNTAHMITWIKNVNGIIFASAEVMGEEQWYAQILKSEDNGDTWETIRMLDRHLVFGNGYHFRDSNLSVITGETAPSLILGRRDEATIQIPAARLYSGGDHYMAMFYVQIPQFPVDGVSIRVCTKGNETSTLNTFSEADISNLLVHYKLNEGSGVVITDSSGNGKHGVLTEGTGHWNDYSLNRVCSFYPAITKPGASYMFSTGVNDGSYITITGSGTDPALQLVKNFSIVFWGVTSYTAGAQRILEKFILGWGIGIDGSRFYFRIYNGSTFDYYYVPGNFRVPNGYVKQLGIIVSNDTPATVKFIVNGVVSEEQTILHDISPNAYNIIIGANGEGVTNFNGSLDDFRIYNKALSDDEVQSLYEYYGGQGWNPLISSVIQNDAPAHVVLTFSEGMPELLAGDITCTVNGVARSVSSASWSGAVWTVVLASAVEYGDVVVMTLSTGQTAIVANNVLTYAALLTSIGTGADVSTLRMQVSADITVTLGANAKFYSDAGGTLDESATWTITAGALRTIYLKCTTGTATMTFSDASKVTNWGTGTVGWSGSTNSPMITIAINKLPLVQMNLEGIVTLTGAAPAGLLYLRIFSQTVTWATSGAFPLGLTFLMIVGNSVAWEYDGTLPTGLTYLYINSSAFDWTGLDIGDAGNITNLTLTNFRIEKMSSADMITLLTQLTNRKGTLPATITINDYADYDLQPAGVTDAVDALKLEKSVTTVNLGA